MKKLYNFLFLSLLIGACTKPYNFEVDNKDYQPKLVVNNLFQQDVPFEIVVSKSVNVYDTVAPSFITTALVKLYINGIYTETLTPFGNGYYNATSIPKPGNTYKLTVSQNGLKDVETVNTLPNPVKIVDWYYVDSTMKDNEGKYFGDLSFTINDPAEENNYLLGMKFWDDSRNEYLNLSEYFCDDQSLNGNLAKRLTGGEYLFTDKLYNGKRKSFLLHVPCGLYIGTPNFLLKLYSVSKDCYFYLFSQPRTNNTINSSPIYSNVTNGLGIFAGRSLDVDTIK